MTESSAFGDIDNDGDIDVNISNNNGRANILICYGKPIDNWIGFLLEGIVSNKDAIGSHLTVETEELIQKKVVNAAGGYLASNDKRVLFGLGKASNLKMVQVELSSGCLDTYYKLETNRYYKIIEGENIEPINFKKKK